MKILTSKRDIKRQGSSFTTVEKGKYIVLISFRTPIAYYNTETGELHRTWAGWSSCSMAHVRKCFRIPSMTKDMWYGMKLEQSILFK